MKEKRREELNDDQVKVLVDEILGTGDIRALNAFVILLDSIVLDSDDQAVSARKWAFVYFVDHNTTIITEAVATIRKRFLTTGKVKVVTAKGGAA